MWLTNDMRPTKTLSGEEGAEREHISQLGLLDEAPVY